MYAYLVEIFYSYTLPCEEGVFVPVGFATCDAYFNFKADEMQELSLKTIYLVAALMVSSMVGSIIMYKAFGIATERINKRVRDQTFTALLRQEVGWYSTGSGLVRRPIGRANCRSTVRRCRYDPCLLRGTHPNSYDFSG